MDESQKLHAEQNKSEAKRYILSDSIYMKVKKRQNQSIVQATGTMAACESRNCLRGNTKGLPKVLKCSRSFLGCTHECICQDENIHWSKWNELHT